MTKAEANCSMWLEKESLRCCLIVFGPMAWIIRLKRERQLPELNGGTKHGERTSQTFDDDDDEHLLTLTEAFRLDMIPGR